MHHNNNLCSTAGLGLRAMWMHGYLGKVRLSNFELICNLMSPVHYALRISWSPRPPGLLSEPPTGPLGVQLRWSSFCVLPLSHALFVMLVASGQSHLSRSRQSSRRMVDLQVTRRGKGSLRLLELD